MAPQCPECGSFNVFRSEDIWMCRDCAHEWPVPREEETGGPNIEEVLPPPEQP